MRRLVLMIITILSAFAAFSVSAGACLSFGYQPEVPDHLR